MSQFELIAIAIFMLVVMTGLGATLTIRDFVEVMKNPKPMICGLAAQFIIMPSIAFTVAIGLGLPDVLALSTVLLGASPGGVNSNLFSYYSRGHVSLSISMTVCSSFMCLVTIPIILIIFARVFSAQDIVVPVSKVMQSLIVVVIPVILGLWIRTRSEKLARTIERIASRSGLVMVVGILASTLYRNWDTMEGLPVHVFLAGLLVSLLGFLIGYWGSRGLGLSLTDARTICFETGLQNVSLTIAIVVFSFAEEQQLELLVVPAAYMVFVLPLACLITAYFRRNVGREV